MNEKINKIQALLAELESEMEASKREEVKVVENDATLTTLIKRSGVADQILTTMERANVAQARVEKIMGMKMFPEEIKKNTYVFFKERKSPLNNEEIELLTMMGDFTIPEVGSKFDKGVMQDSLKPADFSNGTVEKVLCPQLKSKKLQFQSCSYKKKVVWLTTLLFFHKKGDI